MKKIMLSAGLLFSAKAFSQNTQGDTLKKEKNIDEVVIVSSSRTNQKIENSPVKVEVLGKEDMQEESGIKPAGIGSILGDVSGVQIQQTSAVSGNASVRIQGLDGRYTQILRDGMPLFEGFSGGLGVLNMPPLDLQQVELIKGSASTLYGGGAIGGLVNIISRKPSARQELTALANYSTLDEKNLNLFASKKFKFFGYTFFAGGTSQRAQDVNKDGFSDVPRTRSVVVHPKIFFYPSSDTGISLGWSGTFDNNLGGDIAVINGQADQLHQYFEQNRTQRNTYEFILEQKFHDNSKVSFKNALSNFKRNFSSSDNFVNALQRNYFSELSYVKLYHRGIWVLGIDLQGTRFRPEGFKNFHIPEFENSSVGLFAQNTFKLNKTTIETGLRSDFTNHYGSFFIPSVAAIHHFDDHWGIRSGIGWGYKVPNAMAPTVYEDPLETLLPLNTATVKAEQSTGYNLEFNYKKKWASGNEIFINQAFFLTDIAHPVTGNKDLNGNVYFRNENHPVVSKGFDTYAKATLDDWKLYLGYTYTLAQNKFLNERTFIPLTPKNRFAMTALKEFDGWKTGLEASYTGRQYRLDDSLTPAYLFIAAMVSKEIGEHLTFVINCENILDYRQSRKESLYDGPVSAPVFRPLWAPIDGRVVNFSVKLKL